MIVATRHLLVTRVESKVNNGLKLMLLGSDSIIISLYRIGWSPSHNSKIFRAPRDPESDSKK